MKTMMGNLFQHHKVFRSVITWITVDVMNVLRAGQESAMFFFHNKPMFWKVFSGSSRMIRHIDPNIPFAISPASAFPSPVLRSLREDGYLMVARNEPIRIAGVISSLWIRVLRYACVLAATAFTQTRSITDFIGHDQSGNRVVEPNTMACLEPGVRPRIKTKSAICCFRSLQLFSTTAFAEARTRLNASGDLQSTRGNPENLAFMAYAIIGRPTLIEPLGATCALTDRSLPPTATFAEPRTLLGLNRHTQSLHISSLTSVGGGVNIP